MNELMIVGGGYVGVEYAKLAKAKNVTCTIVDVDQQRVTTLNDIHCLGACTWADVKQVKYHRTWMVCVPTPVTVDLRPDTTCVYAAVDSVVKHSMTGDALLLVSTVDLVTLDRVKRTVLEADMVFAHTPERMAPGDTVPMQMVHLIGADSQRAADAAETALHGLWLTTEQVSSPTVAALSKLLENTKRDVNIALLNEFAVVARNAGVSMSEVLAAAETKRGFVDAAYTPGLVGGHCVAVDPWLFAASGVDVDRSVVVAARRFNAAMATKVAALADGDPGYTVILGATFKPNCPDVRNCGGAAVARELLARGARVVLVDPVADLEAFRREHRDLTIVDRFAKVRQPVDTLVLLLAHDDAPYREDMLDHVVDHGIVVDPWQLAPWIVMRNEGRLRYISF